MIGTSTKAAAAKLRNGEERVDVRKDVKEKEPTG